MFLQPFARKPLPPYSPELNPYLSSGIIYMKRNIVYMFVVATLFNANQSYKALRHSLGLPCSLKLTTSP